MWLLSLTLPPLPEVPARSSLADVLRVRYETSCQLVDSSPNDDFTFHDWAVKTKTDLNDSVSAISQALVLEHIGIYPIMSGCLTNNLKIHEITKHIAT